MRKILILIISFILIFPSIVSAEVDTMKPNPKIKGKPQLIYKGYIMKTPSGYDFLNFQRMARLGSSLSIFGAGIGEGGLMELSESEVIDMLNRCDARLNGCNIFADVYHRMIDIGKIGLNGFSVAGDISWSYLFGFGKEENLPFGIRKDGDSHFYDSQFYDYSVRVNLNDICNGPRTECYVQNPQNKYVLPEFYQPYIELLLERLGSGKEVYMVIHISWHPFEMLDKYLVTYTVSDLSGHALHNKFDTYAQAVSSIETYIRTGLSSIFSGYRILEINGVPANYNPVINDNFITIAPEVTEVPGIEIAPDEVYIPAIVEIDGQRYWETFEPNPNYIPNSPLSPSENPEYITIYEPVIHTFVDNFDQPYFENIPSHVPSSYEPPIDFDFDPPSGGGLDFSPMMMIGENFKEKFPFSIPWDLKRQLEIFDVEPEAPYIEVDIDEFISLGDLKIPLKFEMDFSQFDVIATITRWFTTVLIDIGFILIIRRLLPEQ